MPEEQAFSVLVKIMFDYGLRDFFRNDFSVLHLHFYQLERLLQVKCHTLNVLLKVVVFLYFKKSSLILNPLLNYGVFSYVITNVIVR
jgi:hypothetical protein